MRGVRRVGHVGHVRDEGREGHGYTHPRRRLGEHAAVVPHAGTAGGGGAAETRVHEGSVIGTTAAPPTMTF